jgi:hypothetical protein
MPSFSRLFRAGDLTALVDARGWGVRNRPGVRRKGTAEEGTRLHYEGSSTEVFTADRLESETYGGSSSQSRHPGIRFAIS